MTQMTQIDALRVLENMVSNGESHIPSLIKVLKATGFSVSNGLAAYNGSLDAAKELHSAVLPNWEACLHLSGNAWVYIPTRNAPPKMEARVSIGGNPARACLLAIIRALIAQLEGE